MNDYYIAVLDIGKTNKKMLIFDSALKLVDQRYTRIPEIERDGILLDDISGLKSWILETLTYFAGLYKIRVISTSAHGATYALVDENMEHVMPQVAYNTDPGEDFHRHFYNICGDPVELQKSTATPNFNLLINPTKGILFSREHFRDGFDKAKHILLYAQYFGAWLTGNVCADPTYAGNHSYLWDFDTKSWSQVSDKLGIRALLPKSLKSPWDVLGNIRPEIAEATGLSPYTIVTVGIHDSNASLLPYMVLMEEPFLLNSTGTWCVIMNEKEEVKFADDELGKVVFYNMNAFRKPVKTAIFLGGMEFEHYTGLFKHLNNREDFPVFNKNVYEKVIRENAYFILPSVARGIGQFPDSRPRVIEHGNVFELTDIEHGKAIPGFFSNYEEAFAVLNLSLAIQTKVSFDRAGIENGMQVFTEGGFSKNDSYNILMTAFYPESSFFLTQLKEASAFGAAMCAKAAKEGVDIRSFKSLIEIDKIPVEPISLKGIDAYYKKYISLI